MKTVTYRLIDGTDKTIEYDETAPCWYCGLPVGSASMGGTVVCPSCDCGMNRDGSKWAEQQAAERFAHYRKASEPVEGKQV